MAIYDFFLSRNNAASTPANYIGHKGRLFYNSTDGLFRLSDGVTPGGKVVANLALASTGTTAPINPFPGELWYNPTTKELWAYHNGAFRGTVNAATTSTIGGIKAGPGVVVASDGTLSLDSTGIPFNFGDFYAFTNPGASDGACLSSINLNQNIVFVSNGTGGVKVIGDFDIYKTNTDVEEALQSTPVFSISRNGNVQILAPNAGGIDGAIEIIGNSTGTTVSPNQTGVVMHITGNQDMVSRQYIDGVNSYALLAGRRYNGTPSNPGRVLNGELFFRIAGQASTGTSFGIFGPCQIDWVATEDQGPNNQGGELRIRATPNGTSAVSGIVQVAAFNATTGVTATKFNGPLTGNVSATAITATNITVTGNINGNLSGTTVTAGTVQATTGTFTRFSGKFVRAVRNAGTIGAGGTLTIDFTTDAVVHCVWGDGMTINYQNYLPGSVVRVIATKASGTGVDTISLDGLTAANVSSGSTTSGNYSDDTTAFIEFTCVGTTIGSVYAKF